MFLNITHTLRFRSKISPVYIYWLHLYPLFFDRLQMAWTVIPIIYFLAVIGKDPLLVLTAVSQCHSWKCFNNVLLSALSGILVGRGQNGAGREVGGLGPRKVQVWLQWPKPNPVSKLGLHCTGSCRLCQLFAPEEGNYCRPLQWPPSQDAAATAFGASALVGGGNGKDWAQCLNPLSLLHASQHARGMHFPFAAVAWKRKTPHPILQCCKWCCAAGTQILAMQSWDRMGQSIYIEEPKLFWKPLNTATTQMGFPYLRPASSM